MKKTDKPKEIIIEVSSICNFNCNFCFNEKGERGEMSKYEIKKILDHIADLEIGILRFTGGEPFLRPDLVDLIEYSNNKNLSVRINTNGSLLTRKVVKKLKGKVDGVLISIQNSDPGKEDMTAGRKNVLLKKMKAIKYLKDANIPVIRVGTVISKESVKDYNSLFKLIKKLNVYSWEWYRQVNKNKKELIEPKLFEKLADKILKTKSSFPIKIANFIPFCIIEDMDKMAQVARGGIYDNGNTRLVIDSRGFVKSDYYSDDNLGGALDIIKAWNNPKLIQNRGLKNLIEKCYKCEHLAECRGIVKEA